MTDTTTEQTTITYPDLIRAAFIAGHRAAPKGPNNAFGSGF